MDTETCACVLNMKLKPSDAFWHLMKLGFLQPPKFSFYDASKPTFTSPRYLPPTKIERCRVSSYSTQPFFSWLLYKFWSLSHTCHESQPSSVRKTTFSSSGWTTGSSYMLKSCTHLMMISHCMQVKDSIISHGCFLQECSVEHSVVGVRSRLESGVQLKVWSQKWKYQSCWNQSTWPIRLPQPVQWYFSWFSCKIGRFGKLQIFPNFLCSSDHLCGEVNFFAGHNDDGGRFIWDGGGDVLLAGWGQGSFGCWRKYKDKVCTCDLNTGSDLQIMVCLFFPLLLLEENSKLELVWCHLLAVYVMHMAESER